jgi:D-alanyl-D-alanine carboxypeptidase
LHFPVTTRRGGRSLATALAGLAFALGPAAGPALATASAPASRYASIVMDADTGTVLYERNADLPRHPASLTKIMTLYLCFEALAHKQLALGDELPVSAYAAGRDPSRLDLAPGARLKVEDAIRAMTTKSANDAACVIAERLGNGSEQKFSEMMTAKAKALGMTQTAYFNASGLPEDRQVTSARDLAILSRALIRDYPEYYRYFSTNSFDFHGTRFPNQNRFLHTYYGADGIKTGFVNASGHNLAASAVRGGKRLIAIVLGGDTQAWTREHATRLLDVAYAKIDPSLVMVATNEAGEPEAPAEPTPAPVEVASIGPAAAAQPSPAPTAKEYSTPAGAVTISSSLPPTAVSMALPNATANMRAYAATMVPKVNAAAQADAATSASARPSAQAGAGDKPARPGPSPGSVAAVPATHAVQETLTEEEIARFLAAQAEGGQPVSAGVTRPQPRPVAAPPAPARTAPAPAAASAAPARPAGTSSPARAGEPAKDEATAVAPEAEVSSAAPAGGNWSVQIGLFRDATVARRRGEEARSMMPLQLRDADLVVGRAQDGVHVTSRISRLSEQDARTACTELQRGRVPCVVIPPGRPLVVATN